MNTGTYLVAPGDRYLDGADLSGVSLARTVGLPAVVVRVTGTQQPGVDVGTLAGAAWLASQDPALVGIDALSIDDTADSEQPAHTLPLAAGIPVVEHLTGLGQLPPAGAAFTAVALRVEGLGTIPVRAFALLPR